MYKEIIITLSLLATVSNAALNGYKDCGTTLAIVKEVRVTNCTQVPCTFVKGNSYDLEVDAQSLGASNTLPFTGTAKVIVIVPIVINVLSGDVCNYLTDGQCPVVPGNNFTAKITYVVPDYMPSAKGVATTTVKNDDGEIGICLEMDVIVK